ncbi:hypothetical protein [Streptomyces sp. NPDC005322]
MGAAVDMEGLAGDVAGAGGGLPADERAVLVALLDKLLTDVGRRQGGV